MIMAQGLYQAIKRQQPDAKIDVLAPAWSAGILQRMPEVRNVIDMPMGHGQFGWSLRRELGRTLRGQYDQAFVLPNSWKSALVPWFARVPVRTGYTGEMRVGLLNDRRALNKTAVPRLVDRYRLLAYDRNQATKLPGAINGPFSALPMPALTVNPELQQQLLGRLNLSIDRPILALCPGAEFGPAKRWPADYYAQAALAHMQQGWQVWLFGSANDAATTRAITEKIAQKNPQPTNPINCIDLAGKTSLAQVVDLLALARLVITNDSGLMHVAAAVGVPVVAIYGSSDPAYTPPLSTNAKVVRLGLSCSPCFKKVCPLGHTNCLNQLKPDQVLQAAATYDLS
jgi:heptosyltransferase II